MHPGNKPQLDMHMQVQRSRARSSTLLLECPERQVTEQANPGRQSECGLGSRPVPGITITATQHDSMSVQ